MKQLCVLGMAILVSSCAAIVKSNRQQVVFRGGPESGVTKIITPDGTLEIENGSGSYLMTRSRSDIPLKIMCPDGTSKAAMAETSFDWLAGGAGNLVSWFALGWIVDGVSDKGYNIQDVSLASYCSHSSPREVASEKNGASL